MTVRKADLVTLSSAATATLGLGLAVRGELELALRFLFLAYMLDVVDGIVARFEGPTHEGFMLDRTVDRFNQVIVPSIILLIINNEYFNYYVIYATLLIPTGFYRLIYRQVKSREYFNGLPFITHSLYILFTLVSKSTPNPLVLFGLLLATILPIPYYRRPVKKGQEDASFKYRQTLYDVARLSFIGIFIALPYNEIIKVIASSLSYAIILYAILGYLPFIIKKLKFIS